MFMTDEDALASPSHAVLHIVLFEALQACEYGGVFFRLCFFGAESVVRERVQADCFGLVVIKGFRKNRRIRGLQGGGCDGRHLVCDCNFTL